MSDTTKFGGGLKLGKSTSAPTQEEGLIYYDDTLKKFRFRNDQVGYEDIATVSDIATAGGDFVPLDGSAAMTAAFDAGNFKIINLDDGLLASDAVNRGQLDSVVAGIDLKESCSYATTAALPSFTGTATGTLTLTGLTAWSPDGTAVVNGERVMVKDQGGADVDNGIYVVSGVGVEVVLTRSADADESAEVTSGMFAFIESGTANNNTGWAVITSDPITINVTPFQFSQFQGLPQYTASGGITLTGADFSLTGVSYTSGEQTKLSGIESGATADQTGAEIKVAYEAELDTNAFTDASVSKLAGIEAGATADQTGAEIKAAYELEANAFTDAQFTKLAGIESGATADQTGAEIKVAYEAELNTNAFTDAEQTKLAGIAAGATVYTDADAISAPLTGYVIGSGAIAATDTILEALQKVEGTANAGAGASLALDNLASVAINTALLPASTASNIDLGADTKRFNDLLLSNNLRAPSHQVQFDSGSVLGTLGHDSGINYPSAPAGSFVTVRSEFNGTYSVGMYTGNDNQVDANATKDIVIDTGNKIGVGSTGNSGSINLTTGTTVGGARGAISLDGGSIKLKEGGNASVAGYIWTATDTLGSGNWEAPGVGADGLGDHTATQDLKMEGFSIITQAVDSANSDALTLSTGATTTSGISGDIVLSVGSGFDESGAIRMSSGGGAEFFVASESANEVFLGMTDNLGSVNGMLVLEGSVTDTTAVNGGATEVRGGGIDAISTGAVETFQMTSGRAAISSGFTDLDVTVALNAASTVELSSGQANILTNDAFMAGSGAVGASSGSIGLITGAAVGTGTRGNVEIQSAGCIISDGTNPGVQIVNEAGFAGMAGQDGNPGMVTFVSGSHGEGAATAGELRALGGDNFANAVESVTGGNLVLRSGGDPNGDSALEGATDYAVHSGSVTIKTETAKIGNQSTINAANAGDILIQTGAGAGAFGEWGSIIFNTGENASSMLMDTDGTDHFLGSSDDLGSLAVLHLEGSIMTTSAASQTGGNVKVTSGGQDFDGSLTAATVYNSGNVIIDSGYLQKADITAGAFDLSMNSGNITIQTTDGQAANGGSGSSGDVIIATGGAEGSAGERGAILMSAPAVGRSTDGVNFLELQYVDAATLTNSATTHVGDFDMLDTDYSGAVIDYTITEAVTGEIRTGTLRIAHNGTNAFVSDVNAESANIGVSWAAAIGTTTANTIELRATVAGVNNCTMRADMKKFRK